MCNIDDAERMVGFESWRSTARKSHTCSECRREIAKGERYVIAKGLVPGDGWWKTKQCVHCEVGAAWLLEECGGWCFDMVREEIREHADEYRKIGLWRLTAGMKRKWQRFDGAGLMPVPRMPPVTDARHT